MAHFPLAPLLYFYGAFLVCCGIVSVIFIGIKAKTALLSGGMSGTIAILTAYMVNQEITAGPWAGIALTFILLVVFSWRSTKTLLRVLELTPTHSPELHGKVIAFLIISLMAIVTIFVLILQIIYL